MLKHHRKTFRRRAHPLVAADASPRTSTRNPSARPLTLQDLPNIGPAIARDLRTIGINRPAQLKGNDPYALYEKLCRITATRHDPCVLDTFIAAVRFAEGAPARPWWTFTTERKRTLAAQRPAKTKR